MPLYSNKKLLNTCSQNTDSICHMYSSHFLSKETPVSGLRPQKNNCRAEGPNRGGQRRTLFSRAGETRATRPRHKPCWDLGKVNEIISRWKVLSVPNITVSQLSCYWGRRTFVWIVQEQAALRQKVVDEM